MRVDSERFGECLEIGHGLDPGRPGGLDLELDLGTAEPSCERLGRLQDGSEYLPPTHGLDESQAGNDEPDVVAADRASCKIEQGHEHPVCVAERHDATSLAGLKIAQQPAPDACLPISQRHGDSARRQDQWVGERGVLDGQL